MPFLSSHKQTLISYNFRKNGRNMENSNLGPVPQNPISASPGLTF